MKRAVLFSLLVGCLVAFVISSAVFGHAQRTAITKVLFNPRTQNLEVVHRFHLHDAEHAVGEIFGKGADIVGSEETRARFAAYVTERFSIFNGETNTVLALTFVGHEVEGKFIWIYQEAPAPEARSLAIAHNALRDIWPDQINTVNVEGDFGIQSAQFDGAIEIAKIELKPQSH